MDAHMRQNMNQERDAATFFVTTLMDPTGNRAIQGVADVRAMLYAGFPTIRDVGSDLRRRTGWYRSRLCRMPGARRSGHTFSCSAKNPN